VQIKVGNGLRTLFWRDRWLNGRLVVDIAPTIAKLVETCAYNARTVAQGLADHCRVLDIEGTLTASQANECARLWLSIQSVSRDI
jgi:hypothetical protein